MKAAQNRTNANMEVLKLKGFFLHRTSKYLKAFKDAIGKNL